MPRRPVGFWDARSKRHYARLGDVNPKTGKRRAFMLRHEDGRTIAQDDAPAVAAAISRRLADLENAERRASGPTVAEVCTAYVAWHAEQGSAERTVKDHHYHLTRFCKFAPDGIRYGDRPAATIEPADVWALDGNFGSLRLMYASVMACWSWAARPVKGRSSVRLIPTNPLARLPKPPRGKITRKVVEWPTVRRLIRFAWGRSKGVGKTRRERTRIFERLRVLALRFMAETGCRPGEASSLEWGDLILEERRCVIPSERTKTRKTGRDRRFALSVRTIQLLEAAKRHPAAHPKYVFVPAWTRSAKPPAKALTDWWRKELKPAALAAGIELPKGISLYWLRHTLQSEGLEAFSAERIAAVAGNSPAVLMSTYSHQADRDAREVADTIARRRRSKPSS